MFVELHEALLPKDWECPSPDPLYPLEGLAQYRASDVFSVLFVEETITAAPHMCEDFAVHKHLDVLNSGPSISLPMKPTLPLGLHARHEFSYVIMTTICELCRATDL